MATEDFFYPEDTPNAGRTGARRRPPRRGSLPWLLLALLVAGTAGAAVWVHVPLRAQLQLALRDRAAASQALATLRAQVEACAAQADRQAGAEGAAGNGGPVAAKPGEAPAARAPVATGPGAADPCAPGPGAAGADPQAEAAAWAQARLSAVREALDAKGGANGPEWRDQLALSTEGGALVVRLPVALAFAEGATLKGGSSGPVAAVLAAVAAALRADEAPYHLEVGLAEGPEGQGAEAGHRRRHRGQKGRRHRASQAPTAADVSARRVVALVEALRAYLPLRPTSRLVAGLTVAVPTDGPATGPQLTLRLSRDAA